jgi:hypothetical protein
LAGFAIFALLVGAAFVACDKDDDGGGGDGGEVKSPMIFRVSGTLRVVSYI